MRHKPGCGRYYFAHGAVEWLAYFGYILSAESINQRSFLPATHGTRLALHRSVERDPKPLDVCFLSCEGFYQAAHKRVRTFGFAVQYAVHPTRSRPAKLPLPALLKSNRLDHNLP